MAGDDFIFGYGWIDRMKGGAGNDVIDGSDHAIFDGSRADGYDRHSNLAQLRFSDGDISNRELAIV